jgi:tRNA pseudouridine13 synthase
MQNALSFLSKSPGMGGSIKQSPEEFIVCEILQDGTVLKLDKKVARAGTSDGKFAHFVLQKKSWATADALRTVAGKLGIGKKSVSCAGTKDRNAVTVQLASAYGVSCERVMAVNAKDISILGCWQSEREVSLGDLLGNHFHVRVSGKIAKGAEKRVAKIFSELDCVFPNYFGEQRFGSRGNTHIVGKKILQGNFRGAAMEYLYGTGEGGIKGAGMEAVGGTGGAIAARDARKRLAQEKDFAKAFVYYPQFLKYERYMLSHLAKIPTDFAGAMRKLPRGVLLMLVHAYQSYLFNLYVSERVREKDFEAKDGEYYCKRGTYGFPNLADKCDEKTKNSFLACKVLGYESKPNEEEVELLEQEGIMISDFKCKGMPEIGSKGSTRVLLAPLVNFSFKDATFCFDLQAGSYATVALREFLERKKD